MTPAHHGCVACDFTGLQADGETPCPCIPSDNLRSENRNLKRSNATLEAEAAALRTERDELRSYAHEATKAITGLTIGGSEFFGKKIGDIYTADLPFCVERIRESQTADRERYMRLFGELQAARSALANRERNTWERPDEKEGG